jgi:anti-sigma regulatory factor (Ser/Thr protein kinase)
LVNAAAHGEGGPVLLTVTADEQEVAIEISDRGPPFDPLTEAPPPVLEGSIEDRPIGGLGLYFVRTFVDEASYRREDDRNLIRLAMKRAP